MKISVAFAACLALIWGCGGRGGSSSQPPSMSHIYIGDAANGRIVRFNDMTGAGWSEKTGAEGGGTPFALNNTMDVAFDSQGRMYVCDNDNNRVVRFDSFGSVAQISFGTSGNGVNQFDSPRRIAIDPQDRIYICDRKNNRVVRIDDMTGTGWTTFGTFGSGQNQLSDPFGIAFDGQGRIYFCDSGNARIVRVDDMTGAGWTVFGTTGNGVGQLSNPAYIRIVSGNKMLIADKGNNRVVMTDLMASTGWQEFHESEVIAVHMDSTGKIYVVNQNDYVLRRYNDMADTSPVEFGSVGSGTNQFDSPTSVIIGP